MQAMQLCAAIGQAAATADINTSSASGRGIHPLAVSLMHGLTTHGCRLPLHAPCIGCWHTSAAGRTTLLCTLRSQVQSRGSHTTTWPPSGCVLTFASRPFGSGWGPQELSVTLKSSHFRPAFLTDSLNCGRYCSGRDGDLQVGIRACRCLQQTTGSLN